eukprot:3399620-Prymnesium_polylepis.1
MVAADRVAPRACARRVPRACRSCVAVDSLLDSQSLVIEGSVRSMLPSATVSPAMPCPPITAWMYAPLCARARRAVRPVSRPLAPPRVWRRAPPPTDTHSTAGCTAAVLQHGPMHGGGSKRPRCAVGGRCVPCRRSAPRRRTPKMEE